MGYLEAVKKSDIEEGDTVRVVRIWPTHKGGWKNVWSLAMDYAIGNTYKVVSNSESSMGVYLEGSLYAYPIYSLELVKKAQPPAPVEVFKEGDLIKVVGRKHYGHGLPIGSVGVVTRCDRKDTNSSYEVESPTQKQNLHPDDMEHWDG